MISAPVLHALRQVSIISVPLAGLLPMTFRPVFFDPLDQLVREPVREYAYGVYKPMISQCPVMVSLPFEASCIFV